MLSIRLSEQFSIADDAAALPALSLGGCLKPLGGAVSTCANAQPGPHPRPALAPAVPRLSLWFAEILPCLNCIITNEVPKGFP